jgi:methylphosphotriester-DNA--protein-cysteine methyltransferase
MTAPPLTTYAECAPVAPLRPFVQCFWSSATPDGRAPGAVHRVLPDGCIDILVEFADGAAGGRGISPREPRSATVVGAMTRPLVVDAVAGQSFVAVRFRPGWAPAFLGVPAAALTDDRVPLADVWRDAERLRETVSAAPTLAARVRALERSLLERLSAAPAPPPDVRAAVRLVLESGGRTSVGALTCALGVTRQHLARRFAHHVGVPPKMLCRIARAQGVIASVRGGARPSWSAVALEAGYYDQAHLIADFGELTGLTPERWLASR